MSMQAMFGMAGWELGLTAVSALVAITALVRMMRTRRDQLTSELLQQAETDFAAQAAAEQKAKKQAKRRAT